MTQKQQRPIGTSSAHRQFDDAVRARAAGAEKDRKDKSDPQNLTGAEREQRAMDAAIEDSFPASDPPAHSSATTLGPSSHPLPRNGHKRQKTDRSH